MSDSDDMPDLVGCDSTGSSSSDFSESDDDVPAEPYTSTTNAATPSNAAPLSEDDDLPELLSDSDSSSSDDSSSNDDHGRTDSGGKPDSGAGSDDSLPDLVSDCSTSDSDSDSDSDNESQARKRRAAAKAKKTKETKAKKAAAAKAKKQKQKNAAAKAKQKAKKKPKTPAQIMKEDKKEIANLRKELDELQMKAMEQADKNERVRIACARHQNNIDLSNQITKTMRKDEHRIVDEKVHELQWLYKKRNRMQMLHAHMKHKLWLHDIRVNQDEENENLAIRQELDQKYNRKKKKNKKKKKTKNQQKKQDQQRNNSHSIVGRRFKKKKSSELPHMCMLCMTELYEPGMHPLKREESKIKDFEKFTTPPEGEAAGGDGETKTKATKTNEYLLGPKTPEEVVNAGHVGGFSLFCDCCNIAYDAQQKKKKQKKNEKDASGETEEDDLQRLLFISEKWSRMSLQDREKWTKRVKDAQTIVEKRQQSGSIKGIATLSECGHQFHVECIGSYFNSLSSLHVSEKTVKDRISCPRCTMESFMQTNMHVSDLDENKRYLNQGTEYLTEEELQQVQLELKEANDMKNKMLKIKSDRKLKAKAQKRIREMKRQEQKNKGEEEDEDDSEDDTWYPSIPKTPLYVLFDIISDCYTQCHNQGIFEDVPSTSTSLEDKVILVYECEVFEHLMRYCQTDADSPIRCQEFIALLEHMEEQTFFLPNGGAVTIQCHGPDPNEYVHLNGQYFAMRQIECKCVNVKTKAHEGEGEEDGEEEHNWWLKKKGERTEYLYKHTPPDPRWLNSNQQQHMANNMLQQLMGGGGGFDPSMLAGLNPGMVAQMMGGGGGGMMGGGGVAGDALQQLFGGAGFAGMMGQ